jgi:hypothetical protein
MLATLAEYERELIVERAPAAFYRPRPGSAGERAADADAEASRKRSSVKN